MRTLTFLIFFLFTGCAPLEQKKSVYFLVDELISNAEEFHDQKVQVCGYFEESLLGCTISSGSNSESSEKIKIFFLLDGKGYCSMENLMHRSESGWYLIKGDFYMDDFTFRDTKYRYSIQPAEVIRKVEKCF